ncbi:MAG: PEP-CTERM sorting domain-containing protein [Patescibacteria group bacterium]|nr:PEP-CTERM sorting domain-containing protein [Patescibacteria group bacterium]
MKNAIISLTLGLCLLASMPAHGALLDSAAYLANPSFSNPLDATSFVANPSFESPTLAPIAGTARDGCNYQSALPTDWSGGWTETSATNSLRHYRPHTSGLKSNGGYFWDPTDGVSGAALILRNVVPTSWMYQSLGTVSEEDLGLIFIAEIDSSNREGHGVAYDGQRRVSFRTGVTSGNTGSLGQLLSMDLDTATRKAGRDDPWHTLVEWFQPTEADLGKVIFLVFSVTAVPPSISEGQYQFDNVQLWVVPEPGTIGLMVTGMLALLCCMRRRRCH